MNRIPVIDSAADLQSRLDTLHVILSDQNRAISELVAENANLRIQIAIFKTELVLLGVVKDGTAG